MSLPPLADLAAFKLWPGVKVTTDQESSALAVLDAASAAARRRARKTWLNDDGSALAGVPDGVPQVVVAAAARFWGNPQARLMLTAGAESEQWAAVVAGISFTDDELATLLSAAGSTGLWTLHTTRDGDEVYRVGYNPMDWYREHYGEGAVTGCEIF